MDDPHNRHPRQSEPPQTRATRKARRERARARTTRTQEGRNEGPPSRSSAKGACRAAAGTAGRRRQRRHTKTQTRNAAAQRPRRHDTHTHTSRNERSSRGWPRCCTWACKQLWATNGDGPPRRRDAEGCPRGARAAPHRNHCASGTEVLNRHRAPLDSSKYVCTVYMYTVDECARVEGARTRAGGLTRLTRRHADLARLGLAKAPASKAEGGSTRNGAMRDRMTQKRPCGATRSPQPARGNAGLENVVQKR